MLKKSQRIGLAVGSLILSLPALLGAVTGSFFVYATAVLGGHNGDAVHAAVKLLSTWKGSLIVMAYLSFIMYVGLFLYLVIRFARGLSLPLLAQLYCVTIVLLAIGERIRLLIVDGNAFFWFGAFSLPHALCLFAIIWLNTNLPKPHVAQRTEALC
jgi:hypothetical protein